MDKRRLGRGMQGASLHTAGVRAAIAAKIGKKCLVIGLEIFKFSFFRFQRLKGA
jgi:hypothetical protein